MNRCRIATTIISILLAVSIHAANPFLDAKDDKPVSAKFRETEWGDEIQQEEIPLTARIVTTRVAKMPWGAIFKVEFTDLKAEEMLAQGEEMFSWIPNAYIRYPCTRFLFRIFALCCEHQHRRERLDTRLRTASAWQAARRLQYL
jgi:hypothetical protein